MEFIFLLIILNIIKSIYVYAMWGVVVALFRYNYNLCRRIIVSHIVNKRIFRKCK